MQNSKFWMKNFEWKSNGTWTYHAKLYVSVLLKCLCHLLHILQYWEVTAPLMTELCKTIYTLNLCGLCYTFILNFVDFWSNILTSSHSIIHIHRWFHVGWCIRMQTSITDTYNIKKPFYPQLARFIHHIKSIYICGLSCHMKPAFLVWFME